MALTYDEVHDLCKILWGPASDHGCATCWSQARDWAYQHTAKIRGEEHASGSGPYSENPEDYAPMCKSCHRRLDNMVTGYMEKVTAAAATPEARRKAVETRLSGPHSKDLVEKMSEVGKAHGAKNGKAVSKRRRQCDECGLTCAPGPMAGHQNSSGHKGYSDIEGEGNDSIREDPTGSPGAGGYQEQWSGRYRGRRRRVQEGREVRTVHDGGDSSSRT